MKQIRKRLTYANVMSSIAVFFVLGGGAAIAAKNVLPKNSVGPKQIRKNAVTAAKIKKNAVTAAKLKNNAVTTAKLKNDAVTGAKVNESTLATVPSAASAASAANASNAANWDRFKILPIVKASHGQTVPLYSHGPFAIYGKCSDAGGGQTQAYTYLTTSEPGSSMSSSQANYTEANFDPGNEAMINFLIESNGPRSNEEYGSYYTGFTALSSTGNVRLAGNMTSAVNYFGSPCSFWGDVLIKS